ncbi:MAG: superoxide dismutase [Fe] [Sandaracinaceae bacterium]|nr:superoxide dismutase [Fe] [Sandaracinaceae bacterium]
MAFTLPELPYSKDALAPHISAETLEFHHGKHHAAYVTKLNGFIEQDASLAGKSLEELVRTTKGGVFNNAAQVWNHTFYWNSMSPSGGGEPRGAIADAIAKSFGSFSDFKEKFSAVAVGHFASGWAWLVKDGDKLEIVDTHDAGCPLTMNKKPILTCDVWEHAYYVDYRNARPKYVESWWNLVNWDHANKQL